jgi:hypothetical protein
VADNESVGQSLGITPTTKGYADLQPCQSLSTSHSDLPLHTYPRLLFQGSLVQVSTYLLLSSLYNLISSPKSELGLVGIVASVLHVFDAISAYWLCLSCFLLFNEMISSRLLRCPWVPVPRGGYDRSAQFLRSLMYLLMLMMFLELNCPIPLEDKYALFNRVDDRAFETQDCFWIDIKYTNVRPDVCCCIFS